MTHINDYLWHLPHDATNDDPPEVEGLVSSFYAPLVQVIGAPLTEHGYNLSSADVMIRVDENLDSSYNMFYANVHFVKYLQPNIMTRVHFWHTEWSLRLADSHVHKYVINLDRFKIVEETKQVVSAWDGRLHTRLSSRQGNVLHFEGDDQHWSYASQAEFSEQLNLFMGKFDAMVVSWLENLTGAS